MLLLAGALALVLCVRADTVPGSSSAWSVTGDHKLEPVDNCISVAGGQALFLVQPETAVLSFQGSGLTIQGGGGTALFTIDGAQNVTSHDTGISQCEELAKWSGLDPSAKHVLRIEAQELVRAIVIAQVSIEGGTANTTSPPPPPTPPPTPPPGSSAGQPTPVPGGGSSNGGGNQTGVTPSPAPTGSAPGQRCPSVLALILGVFSTVLFI